MHLPFTLTLLGGLRVVLGPEDASAVVVTRFRTQKTAALLAYLACHLDRNHPREELIDRFWPDVDFDTGRISLRTALASLRRQIEPPGIAANSVLVANRTMICLNPEAVVTDISRFEAAIAAARRADSPHSRLSELQSGLTLYAGPLLPGFYEEWVLVRREHLAELHRQALRQVVTDIARAGDLPAALAAARRAAGADPQDAVLREILERLLIAADKIDRRDVLRLLEETDDLSPPIISSNSPALESPTGSLPLLLDRFVGRADDQKRLGELLAAPTTRVVTIIGPGGMGKTRLAIELATALRGDWPRGAWFVSLRETQTATGVAIAIRDALHLPAKEGSSPLDQVIDALASQGGARDGKAKALLVLDNFEHLDADATAIVLQLLRALPQLKCLVTSRRRLAIAGERLFSIAPLPVPTTRDAATPQELAAIESVQLFVDRAQASRPDFQITERSAAAVAQLCADLEGIPLAIELAAAWSQVLTPAQMRERLTARFDLLAPRPQAAARSGRPHSLQATIAWSYDLLAPELREFLARLSVFRGGWTAPAAQKIAADSDHALDFLAQLRERSLIRSEETPTGTFRFGMFETIREFAASQLLKAIPIRSAHAEYFTELAEGAEPNLRGPEGPHLLRTLEEEYPNLQAALEYSLCVPDTAIPVLRLASALGWFWDLRGRWSEGRTYLMRAITRVVPAAEKSDALLTAYASALSASGRLSYQLCDHSCARDAYEKALSIRRIEGNKGEIGKLLLGLAGIAFHTGEREQAQTLIEENLRLRREIDDPPGIAAALSGLASIALDREDYGLARTYANESLILWQELGNNGGMAHVLYILGMVAVRVESRREAAAYFERGLALQREINNVQGVCHGLCGLANIALEAREYPKAEQLYAEAQESAQRIGDLWTTAVILNNRSRIAFEQGQPVFAQECARASLRLRHQIGDAAGVATLLDALAIYAHSANAPDRAAFLWGASHTLRETLHKPIEETLRSEQEDSQAAARGILGQAAFDEMWHRGGGANRETVIQFALGIGI